METTNKKLSEPITLFKVLSNPKRLCVLRYLHSSQFATNWVIAKHTGIPQPQVSHAIKLLIGANLIQVERIGSQKLYSLNADEWIKVKPLIGC